MIRPHTHTENTHTGSLVIINGSMMYRDLMDEQSLLNKRVWLHKTGQPAQREKRNVDAVVCFQVVYVEVNCFVLPKTVKTFLDDK